MDVSSSRGISTSVPTSPDHFQLLRDATIQPAKILDGENRETSPSRISTQSQHYTVCDRQATSSKVSTNQMSAPHTNLDDSQLDDVDKVTGSRSYIGAPDGGWGWVVVFASFMISVIADGISFSFGLIFLELSEYFNESKSKTAFVGSLFMSIPLLVGPLASALTEKYGCRKITIVSGLVSCFGFILGTFSTRIEHLFIAFSIAGAGLALSYVTSIVIVAYYFEKKRSLATGLAVCGTGFGTFVFAPLTTFLLERYEWRGCLLIMSGFFLNIVVFGALMRDLPDDEDEDDESTPPNEKSNHTPRISAMRDTQVQLPSFESQSSHLMRGAIPQSPHNLTATPIRTSSLVNIPTYLTHRGSALEDQEVINELSVRKGGYLSRLLQRYPQLLATVFSGRHDRIFGSHIPCNVTASRHQYRPAGSATVSAIERVMKDTKDSTPISGSSLTAVVPGVNTHSRVGGQVRSPLSSNHQMSSIKSPKALAKTLNPVAYRLNSLIPFEHGSQARKLQRGSITYRSAMLNIRRPRVRSSSCPDMVTVAGSSSQIVSKLAAFVSDSDSEFS